MEWAVVIVMALVVLLVGLWLFVPVLFPSDTSQTSSTSQTPSANDSFLAGVRSRSCYAALRMIHGVITTLAVAALAVLWIVLMNAASGAVDRIYMSVVCALITAALFIEYGFFRMIVDAVDVLIDTSRRKTEGNG